MIPRLTWGGDKRKMGRARNSEIGKCKRVSLYIIEMGKFSSAKKRVISIRNIYEGM